MPSACRIRMGGPAGIAHAVAAAATGATAAAAGGVSPRPAVAAVTGGAFIGSVTVREGVYGPGIYGDGLANERIGHSNQAICSYRFRSEQTSTLNSILIYTIVYHAGGYSAGDAGSIRGRLYADDGTANHFPTGSVLATTNTFSPGNPPSTDFPTLTFGVPYGVTAGTLYHIVFDNPHASPATNYHSIDTMYDGAVRSPEQPKYDDTDWGFCVKYGAGAWTTRAVTSGDVFSPILDITYGNGAHQGMAYMESAVDEAPILISGNVMAREVITPSSTVTVYGVGVNIARVSGTDALSIRLETDAGSEIETVTIPAASIALSAVQTDGDMTRASVSFASPRTLTGGSTYRVRLSCAGTTTYRTWTLRRGSAYGFHASTYFADGYAQKTTNGSTWGETRSGWNQTEDIQMYLATS